MAEIMKDFISITLHHNDVTTSRYTEATEQWHWIKLVGWTAYLDNPLNIDRWIHPPFHHPVKHGRVVEAQHCQCCWLDTNRHASIYAIKYEDPFLFVPTNMRNIHQATCILQSQTWHLSGHDHYNHLISTGLVALLHIHFMGILIYPVNVWK